MLDSLFTSLSTGSAGDVSVTTFLLLLGTALILGAVQALVYRRNNRCSKSFAVTLATLPAVVGTVILMVNGSIGAGVAVAGSFSLIRFRSAPGSAKEIVAVFTAMAAGLACGMGCPGLAALFTLVMCLVDSLYARLQLSGAADEVLEKTLQITVPESLEYADVFTDIFDAYLSEAKLTRVKTTNLGSLNRLSYDIKLRRSGSEKAMIDALRCRNGNLEITLAERGSEANEL